MPQGFHEAPDPRTGKGRKHQDNAKKAGKDISNAEVKPSKKPKTRKKIIKSNNIIRSKNKIYLLWYDAVLNYCREYFGINDDVIIELKFRKPNLKRKDFGFIVLNKEKNIITIDDLGLDMSLSQIFHEFTHIKQKLNDELTVKKDKIMWKNDPVITIKDLKAISYEKHHSLPWEIEANSNMSLSSELYKSSQVQNLKGKDETLDFVISLNQMSAAEAVEKYTNLKI